MAGEPDEPLTDDPDGTPASKRQRVSSLSNEPTPPASSVDKAVVPVSSDAVRREWPGLPRGVKFDPSDEELLSHLLAKVGKGVSEPHPLINEFIVSLDEDNGFGYTHPQRLAGVKQDGSVSYFFHRKSKAFNSDDRKLQKMQDADFGVVFWHKIGKTKPVIIDEIHQGCKRIMVLNVVMKKGERPEKTNWVMHQYHLGSGEDGEGEFVVSKIFYQQKSRQSDKSAQGLNPETAEAVVMEGEDAADPISLGPNIQAENQNLDLISVDTSVQGESSTRCSNADSTLDYSSEFTTSEIFKSKEEMIKWARDRGRMNGFAIVIKKSEAGTQGRKPRLVFGCERGGKYRSHQKKSEQTDMRPLEVADSKKCECPFTLKGNKLATEDDWMLVVVCGEHNHPADNLEGSPHAGRLTKEEKALVVELYNSAVKPRDILTILKQRDPLNMATVRTIYNARQKSRLRETGGKRKKQAA